MVPEKDRMASERRVFPSEVHFKGLASTLGLSNKCMPGPRTVNVLSRSDDGEDMLEGRRGGYIFCNEGLWSCPNHGPRELYSPQILQQSPILCLVCSLQFAIYVLGKTRRAT